MSRPILTLHFQTGIRLYDKYAVRHRLERLCGPRFEPSHAVSNSKDKVAPLEVLATARPCARARPDPRCVPHKTAHVRNGSRVTDKRGNRT